MFTKIEKGNQFDFGSAFIAITVFTYFTDKL